MDKAHEHIMTVKNMMAAIKMAVGSEKEYILLYMGSNAMAIGAIMENP